MNILDKLAKKLGYVKRQHTPNFTSAAINRLTADWTTSTLSSDSQLFADLKTLRARARQLRDNNDYAAKFITMCRSNIVGHGGVHLRVKSRDPERYANGSMQQGALDTRANKILKAEWEEWGKPANCTVTGKLSWRDVQHIATETIATDGEVLIRKVRGWPNKWGFALQLLESEYLDIDYNATLENGRRVKMGVELDEWHRPVAYYILKLNPSDSLYATETRTRWERIPAEDIIHPFLPRRPEQTRGWPWMSTAMLRINMLGAYQEAEVTASRVAAAKVGFFKVAGDVKYGGETNDYGNPLMDVQPGSFEKLPMGMDLAAWDPQHPNSAYGAFVKDVLRGISAGMGVGYNSLANDFESVNFSSARFATGEEREVWKGLQSWFVDQVCTPVWEEWLLMALGTSSVPLPVSKFDKFNAPEWRPRRWAYINPVDEIKANIDAIKYGLTSRTRVLAEQNVDFAEIFAELQAEEDLADKLDIVIGEEQQNQQEAAEEHGQANQAKEEGDSNDSDDSDESDDEKTNT